ncbi:hypothetical protein, partial [Klebsiella pneumoniae]|uniref:hypothetical protein n=1 Tax=Klebsiella pneumoniae TaxID=573 RepID=UPI0030075A1F
MIGLLATCASQGSDQLEDVAIAEVACAAVFEAMSLHGLRKALPGHELQDGTEDTACCAEGAAFVELGKESANSIGDKEVIDPFSREAVLLACFFRSALLASAQMQVKKTIADSVSAWSSESILPAATALSIGRRS